MSSAIRLDAIGDDETFEQWFDRCGVDHKLREPILLYTLLTSTAIGLGRPFTPEEDDTLAVKLLVGAGLIQQP